MAVDIKPVLEVEQLSDDKKFGRFVCSPLAKGEGTVIGNSLRRILLSSMPGAAVSEVKIDGVYHEFSSIPGVKEDVGDIILNLKKLAIRNTATSDDPVMAYIDYAGEGIVRGSDIKVSSEVEIINNIDNLTEQNAIFHVLVGIGKSGLHDSLFNWGRYVNRKLFERWEQGVVHKVQQLIACHCSTGMIVNSPILPTAFFRNNGNIVLVIPFPILLFCIIYFQKKHPCNLLNTLGITIDTGVVAHDITESFHKS